MSKDDKINIKLEVCRNKTSGKLSIMAHFDENAPNIFKDKDSYFWMPTTEEKDFLNEAFAMVPMDSSSMNLNNTTSEPEDTEVKAASEVEPEVAEEKPEETPPIEKADEPAIFEVTGNKKDDELPSEDILDRIEEPRVEEPEPSDLKPLKTEEDEGLIVEADSDAIDEALKKHTDKDKSFVEADEKTIVDKVLSQKKKGRWSKK